MNPIEREILKELRTLYQCCVMASGHYDTKNFHPTIKHTRYLWGMFERYQIEVQRLLELGIVFNAKEIKLLFDACLKFRDILHSLEERGKWLESEIPDIKGPEEED